MFVLAKVVFTLDKNARHGANPLRIAEYGARQYPQFFRPVLNSIADLSVDQMCTIMDRVPDHRMSSHAREFAKSMFSYSLSELQRLNQ